MPVKNIKMKCLSGFSPVVLFVYNRLWHTRQTVEALLQNSLAEKSDLIIYSDAAKNQASEGAVREVRDYIATISGFKSINIIEREKNWGLANSIIDGVTAVVNKFGRVIVLEDDMVTSPYFLDYMNGFLELYKADQQVASIHAYTYQIDDLPETFFLKGADCWGWATWADRWRVFNPDGQALLDELKARKLTKEFDFNGNADYVKMLKGQIQGKNDSWAIRWHASAFLNNMLTLYPGVSYVQNIGHDGQGTHCGYSEDFQVEINISNTSLKKIAIEENAVAREKFEQFFSELTPRFFTKILHKIKAVLA